MSGIGAFLSGITGDLTAFSKVTNNPTPSAGPLALPGGGSYDSND